MLTKLTGAALVAIAMQGQAFAGDTGSASDDVLIGAGIYK
jgi:hypothetical protein